MSIFLTQPSTYAYPPALEETKKESKEKVATAVLSITAKQKKKEAEKNKKDGGEAKEEKMDVDDDKKDKKKDGKNSNHIFKQVHKGQLLTFYLILFNMINTICISEGEKKKEASTDSKADVKKTDKDEKETKDGKEKKEAEATFEILNNPARVMKPQLQVIKMEPPNSTEKAMYQPIKDISIGGKLDNWLNLLTTSEKQINLHIFFQLELNSLNLFLRRGDGKKSSRC